MTSNNTYLASTGVGPRAEAPRSCTSNLAMLHVTGSYVGAASRQNRRLSSPARAERRRAVRPASTFCLSAALYTNCLFQRCALQRLSVSAVRPESTVGWRQEECLPTQIDRFALCMVQCRHWKLMMIRRKLSLPVWDNDATLFEVCSRKGVGVWVTSYSIVFVERFTGFLRH